LRRWGQASVLSRVSKLNSDQHLGKAVLIDPDTGQSLAVIKLEKAKYASICGSVLANTEPFMDAGIFDLGLFWTGQKSALPVHYSLWLAEVGCAKVASANVEVVFSCAGRISMKSLCLDLQLFSDYAFLIYNYKYDWLRPKLEEIVAAYMKLYGKELRYSDIESNGTGVYCWPVYREHHDSTFGAEVAFEIRPPPPPPPPLAPPSWSPRAPPSRSPRAPPCIPFTRGLSPLNVPN